MKKIIGVLMGLIICMMVGCNTVNSTKYNGRNLNIAVVGEVPTVRENIVTFNKVSFSDLKKEKFSKDYDAVFISEENLSEASKGEYSYIYKKSTIPFFFIGGQKDHVPFIYEDLSYEEVPNTQSQMYAVGILFDNDDYNYVGYGLYNDTKNKENIEDVYSRIFKSIDEKKFLSEEEL